MIHYQCFIPPPSPAPSSLPPSDFTAAHQILTQSFFDAGVSQDSRKVSVRWRESEASVKAKMRAGPRWKRKNSSSSFVLLDVKSWWSVEKRQAGERKQKNSHPLVFLNRLYESYQTLEFERFREISQQFRFLFTPPGGHVPHRSLVLSFHSQDSIFLIFIYFYF